MSEKLGPEFWEWMKQHPLPPRLPRGSPENRERQRLMAKYQHEWALLQKDKADG